MCFPRIDSPAIFAGLLEPSRGGAFSIEPTFETANVKQMYLPDTNVLLTRFMTPEGVCELMDFMPVPEDGSGASADAPLPNCVIRVVRVVHGRMAFRMRCEPRFDYARGTHTAHITKEDDAVEFHAAANAGLEGGMQLRLNSTLPLTLDDGAAHAEFELRNGESAGFAFGDAEGLREKSFDCEAALTDTIRFWRSWSAQSTYRGRYREVVMRSALTLKLLSSSEHGAIVAAPTFGLAEALDGSRRWDYRFTWIRDAAFSVYALLRLGYTGEARHFMTWIAGRSRHCDSDGSLSVMYTVDGKVPPEETEIAALSNKNGVAGVPLIGNAARDQVQLDVYGALLDAIYLYNKYGAAISHDGWHDVTRTVDYVVEHWREPDHGIWEFRNGLRPLLHSRLMCWVTVDRALRLAEKRSLPAPLKRWFDTRDAIHADIHEHFWNEELNAFVLTPDSQRLDASTLMMPLVRFIGPTDPRWLGTLDAIGSKLKVDPLIFRYTRGTKLDGLPGIEGGFSACSFWYAEALARAGRVDEGRNLDKVHVPWT